MKQFALKKFLSNDPFETGSVSASIEIENSKNYQNLSAELVIKDCYKTVTLDFYAADNEKQEDRLKKLATLIDVLVEFREALPLFYREYSEILKNKGADETTNIAKKLLDTEENQG